MDWSKVSERVVVEACSAHPDDVVLQLGAGDGAVAAALAGRVKRLRVLEPDVSRIEALRPTLPAPVELVRGDLREPTGLPGLSVVVLHETLRRLRPEEQQALLGRVGRLLPARGLLVVGDVLWSLPKEMIDEPEQYGEHLEHAQETRVIERWVRAAGFLPDLHRFGPAVAVLIALKTGE